MEQPNQRGVLNAVVATFVESQLSSFGDEHADTLISSLRSAADQLERRLASADTKLSLRRAAGIKDKPRTREGQSAESLALLAGHGYSGATSPSELLEEPRRHPSGITSALEVAQAENMRLREEIEELRARIRELEAQEDRSTATETRAEKPELTAEELARIPKYPGRVADSLEWYEEHWAPLARKRRVWQHHLYNHDPNLFNTLRLRLYRQGRALWELVPPEPGRVRRPRQSRR